MGLNFCSPRLCSFIFFKLINHGKIFYRHCHQSKISNVLSLFHFKCFTAHLVYRVRIHGKKPVWRSLGKRSTCQHWLHWDYFFYKNSSWIASNWLDFTVHLTWSRHTEQDVLSCRYKSCDMCHCPFPEDHRLFFLKCSASGFHTKIICKWNIR